MKTLTLLFLIFSAGVIHANEIKDIIHDPAISRRCKALLEERSSKVRVQQKLNSLILRNRKLTEKLRQSQKTVRTRLELNKVQLRNNLRLVQMRLKSMEENIVRKGCPGITL